MPGTPPLILAVVTGNKAEFEQLIEGGVDVTSMNEKEETALHWAAAFRNVNWIKRLLIVGANIEATDVDGMTPLGFAVYYGNAKAVEHLCDRGANISHEYAFESNVEQAKQRAILRLLEQVRYTRRMMRIWYRLNGF